MPTTTEKPVIKSVPTSLKLPAELKAQIDETARKAGVSAHAFMVKTLADATARAQQREQFQQDSVDALREMKETGLGHSLEDMREYFALLGAYRKGQGPKPIYPALSKVV
jgi:predicted transcriptional regulator